MAKFTDVLGKKSEYEQTVKKINGVEVKITKFLDMHTYATVIHSIADACFVKGRYKAENRVIARRFTILKYFTNIEVSDDEVGAVFLATQAGTWWDAIEREVVKLPIWAEIEQAVDMVIASAPTAFDRLCDNLSAIIASDPTDNLADIKEVLDGLSKVDRRAFAQAAIENNLTKNKDGDENGGEIS